MSSTKLLGIYSNGMVLQRNKDIVIEGYEDSLENVGEELWKRNIG